jgi:hypothetical protein
MRMAKSCLRLVKFHYVRCSLRIWRLSSDLTIVIPAGELFSVSVGDVGLRDIVSLVGDVIQLKIQQVRQCSTFIILTCSSSLPAAQRHFL